MDNRYEAIKDQAIANCKSGRYVEAEEALEKLLEVLKSFGSPLANSPTMYWYLVARHRGDEKKAMDEFLKL